MCELVNVKLNESIEPMLILLDSKNVTSGINIIEENNKVYITFDKTCLSGTNQVILETISSIYSETLFYSDNQEHPIEDKLEFWCPDEEFAKRTNIRERCKSKKLFVLELDSANKVELMGTTIMLANALQMQDPLELESNKDLNVIDADMNERHEHYIAADVNDSNWFNLSVSLNRNNPLCDNPYAPFMTMSELNSPVSCESIIATTLVGYKEKKYISFCTDEKELLEAITRYFEGPETGIESNQKSIEEVKQRLLKGQ